MGDLDLAAVDLHVVCDGTSMTLSAAIKNEAPTGIDPSVAGIYAGDPAAGGTRLGTVQIPWLVGGERYPFQYALTVPEGTTRIFVVADDEHFFPEGDELNNIASYTVANGCSSNTSPVALCRNVTVSAGASCQASVSVDNGSYDPDGYPGALSVVQSPAGPFPVGTTAVQLTVSDGESSSACSAYVTVVDNVGPTPGANKGKVLTPSAGSDYTLVTLADCAQPATDNCGGTVDVSQAGSIIRVTSDESEDALSILRLLACDDIVLSSDRKSVLLRAESALLGNGRVYTITYSVNDASGNASTGTCKVSVPALLGNPAVESSPVYCQGTACPAGTGPGLLCSLL